MFPPVARVVPHVMACSFTLVARVVSCVVSVLCRACPRVVCTLSCCSRVVVFSSHVLSCIWFACRACCSHVCPRVTRTLSCCSRVVVFPSHVLSCVWFACRACCSHACPRVAHTLSCCFVRRPRAMSRVSFASWRVVSRIVNLPRLESLMLIILVIYLIAISIAD
jgi:hypothetical protein